MPLSETVPSMSAVTATAPVVGLKVKARPSESTAVHAVDVGHARAVNATVPSMSLDLTTAPVDGSNVIILPRLSSAVQLVVEVHATAASMVEASMSMTPLTDPLAPSKVASLPALSTAVHSEVDGHATPFSAWAPSMSTPLRALITKAGEYVTSRPDPSTPVHWPAAGQGDARQLLTACRIDPLRSCPAQSGRRAGGSSKEQNESRRHDKQPYPGHCQGSQGAQAGAGSMNSRKPSGLARRDR